MTRPRAWGHWVKYNAPPALRRLAQRMTAPPRRVSDARYAGLSQNEINVLLRGGPRPAGLGYRHFTRRKPDGTLRPLAEPSARLKAIQRSILRHVLHRPRPHPAAMAYRRKRSIAHHAWAHAGARCVITADIADFFPSTRRARVEAFFQATYNVVPQQARLLAALTTERGSLPQGAITSPALSNLVNIPLDEALAALAAANGARYTRYADDLAFSWPHLDAPPADFEASVRRALRPYGYALHAHKGWRVWQPGRDRAAHITGLVLTGDGRVDVPPELHARLRALRGRRDGDALAQRMGLLGYIAMVQKPRSRT